MLHQPITKPFGDDDDANEALKSVLSIVGRLSVESRKLAQTRWSDMNAEARQKGFVMDLIGRVRSRAVSVHQDPIVFLEAARAMLERKTGRSIALYLPGEAPTMHDEQLRRLEAEAIDADIHEQAMLKRLSKARENFTNAQAANRIARAAADTRRAQIRKGVA